MNKIYYLTDQTNIPKYVGNTKQKLSRRLREHKYFTKNSKCLSDKMIWIKSVNYNITIHLIEECDISISLDREKYWINYYSDLTNSVGGNKKGLILTEEWKRKISESEKGKVLTDEHKNKISKSKVGKEHKHKGHKISDSSKIKISISNKGRAYTNEQKDIILEKKKLTYITCPYCNIHTSKTNINRWHFDKCKLKNNS